MAEDFASKVVAELKRAYGFKRTTGAWLQQGKCPDCGQYELFTAASDPKILRCGRSDKCGFEISVKAALPDLFEDWSKRFERTEAEPNAAADAYLLHERGLDLQGLRDAYSQEWYQDRNTNQGSATVRFPLPGGSYWERIIDRPGRFGKKKANFKFGGQHGGECWAHPEDTFPKLAACTEIWITEGIFDALALRQNFKRLEAKGGRKRSAVSAMALLYPEHFLAKLNTALEGSKFRPTIVFAFDVGAAGVKFARKHVKTAREDGWAAVAAMARPDGEGSKLDWNDLHLRQLGWNGTPESGPMGEDALRSYRYFGDLTIELDPYAKAKLIHEHSARRNFYFRCGSRIFWAKSRGREDQDEAESGSGPIVDEIANCSFRILYRERDEIEDETNYFLEIAFPNNTPTAKARFSAACCAASGEFKKRLFAFSGMWSGAQEQLDRLMRDQTRQLKTVEPIHFTGYSPVHDAWVLGDIAVRGGQVIALSSERYFDFGKSAVKLRSEERLLSIAWNRDQLDLGWVADVWTAWGERGIVALAFFTMSLFAVQIRERDASLGFLEVWGEPGSGKTTLVAFMWRLLGRKDYEGFDPNKATNAAIARNFQKVSNLPVGLIESGRTSDSPSHFRQFDWAELLTLFNGRSPRATGRRTGGTETFEPPFYGSIYAMQNAPVDAMPAVLERFMSIHVDKAAWSETSKAAARRIERYDAEAASSWIIHVTGQARDYLPAFFDAYERHDAGMPKRVALRSKNESTLHNARVIKCHAQLAAAVEVLGALIPASFLPREQIEATLAFVDQMAVDRQAASGADHPVVQRFWEMVDHIIAREESSGASASESLNFHRNPAKIAINLVEFERRARNQNLIPPNDAELKRHLRGSRSRPFLAAKPVNRRGDGKSVHCWVFENPAGTPSTT